MPINFPSTNQPHIVGVLGMSDPSEKQQEITHVELSDGRTIPVSEVTPRMWAQAGMNMGSGFSNEH